MYNSKQFSFLCNKYGYKAVPASNHHVPVYVSYLTDSNPSISKINMAVYSISWTHEIAGFLDPCLSSFVKQVKEGMIRKLSKPTVAKRTFNSGDYSNDCSSIWDWNKFITFKICHNVLTGVRWFPAI